MLDLEESYRALRTTARIRPLAGQLHRISGNGHRSLLSWLVARTTEFAHPNTAIWSLLLDADGSPVGSALALVFESEDLLVLDAPAGWLDEALAAAPSEVLERADVSAIDGFAIAVEGPSAWRIVDPLSREPIADLLLNEIIDANLNGSPVKLARTGTTSEFGYVVAGEGSEEAAVQTLEAAGIELGGGQVDPQSLLRVQVETNHPIVPEQTRGLSVTEAGAAWLVSLTRTDAFYGDAVLNVSPTTRRLVAAFARGEDFPPSGTLVSSEGVVVGAVHLSAPRAGQDDGIGLVILEHPYSVSGLELNADGAIIETVSRPAVTPVSWDRRVGVLS